MQIKPKILICPYRKVLRDGNILRYLLGTQMFRTVKDRPCVNRLVQGWPPSLLTRTMSPWIPLHIKVGPHTTAAGCTWALRALETLTGFGVQAPFCQHPGTTGIPVNLLEQKSLVCEQLCNRTSQWHSLTSRVKTPASNVFSVMLKKNKFTLV